MVPEGSLPHSLAPGTCPYPEPDRSNPCLHISTASYQKISASPRSCNVMSFCGEEFLAPFPSLKLEDHPFSPVRDWLFNVFAATLHIRRPFLHPQPENAPCCGDRDPLIAASFPWEKQELDSRREKAASLATFSFCVAGFLLQLLCWECSKCYQC